MLGILGDSVQTKNVTKTLGLTSLIIAGALMLTACGDAADPGDREASGDREPISIVATPGWTDQTGTAYLYQYVLEDHGYEVEVENLGDMGTAFSAVALGDVDLMGSAWPTRTQASYWQEHQDVLEDLGPYYDNADLFLAVPEYSDIESIEDLPDYVDELDGKIIGIEPGAGLSMITEEVMPHYHLDEDFELQLSSTNAMISTLEAAIDNEDEIVVTLWAPFWATTHFDLRELDDPDGIYGEPESLHTLGREGFSEDYPEVATMIENFRLTDEQFGDLERIMVDDFDDDDDQAAVKAWAEEHPDIIENMSADLAE